MGTARSLMLAMLSLGCLTLAGCAHCFDDAQRPMGFVAPRPHRHAVADQAAPQSAVAKCTRALYLGGATSPEEMRAAEQKCRALIVDQPY